MLKTTDKGKLFTFFCLYIAQSIPMSFFSTVIPVLMRQNSFSLTAIGLLQFIKLPWLVKFMWSPYVDRHTSSLGSYKRWIILSELCYAVLILTVSFLNLEVDMVIIAVLILASFVASATQDIATDALAVRSFDHKGRSLVNSMQSMGSFVGTMVGSGVLLLLFKKMGWNAILPALAAFVIVALIPLVLMKGKLQNESEERKGAKWVDIIDFFKQTRIWRQIGYLILCYSGLIGTLAMLRPYMVDMGYTMQEIGMMSGIFGTSMGFVFSFFGGMLLRNIGRRRSRIVFAAFVLFTTIFFCLNASLGFVTWSLYLGIALLWGAYGLSTVVVYTTAMDYVRPGREGTDFTLQTVVTHISSMVMALASGKIADHFGYVGLFRVEILFATAALLYAIFLFKPQSVKR